MPTCAKKTADLLTVCTYAFTTQTYSRLASWGHYPVLYILHIHFKTCSKASRFSEVSVVHYAPPAPLPLPPSPAPLLPHLPGYRNPAPPYPQNSPHSSFKPSRDPHRQNSPHPTTPSRTPLPQTRPRPQNLRSPSRLERQIQRFCDHPPYHPHRLLLRSLLQSLRRRCCQRSVRIPHPTVIHPKGITSLHNVHVTTKTFLPKSFPISPPPHPPPHSPKAPPR